MHTAVEHKYTRLLTHIRAAIQDGTYPEGSRLEPELALAECFGVSRQTVRRAFGVLEEEGYVVRRQGSGTFVRSSQNSRKPLVKLIGVVTTYISDYILPSFIRGIEEVTEANGYSFVLRSTGNRVDKEREVLSFFLESRVDGLIIEGAKTAFPNPNMDIFRQLEQQGIPLVFMNGYYPALSEHPYVITDDRAGGEMAARHLLEAGHRRIGGIFKVDDRQGHERYAGFAEALRKEDVSLQDACIQWYTTEMRDKLFSGAASLLPALHGCTAVICYNDEVAAPLEAALLQAGLRVPEDMAVISFDDSQYAAFAPVPLTSLAHPKEEVGRTAARMLLKLVRGKRVKSVVLPWKLVRRGSA